MLGFTLPAAFLSSVSKLIVSGPLVSRWVDTLVELARPYDEVSGSGSPLNGVLYATGGYLRQDAS